MNQCHMYTAGVRCTKPASYQVYLLRGVNHSYKHWETFMCYNHVDLYEREYYKVRQIGKEEIRQ